MPPELSLEDYRSIARMIASEVQRLDRRTIYWTEELYANTEGVWMVFRNTENPGVVGYRIGQTGKIETTEIQLGE